MGFIILMLFGLLNSVPLVAQDWDPPPYLLSELHRAKDLLLSFDNDSANVVLAQIVVELKKLDQLDSSFGMEVQVREAEALEKDHQDEIAITKLLHVVDLSQVHKEWKVLTNAHLSLARLHEKLGREERCLYHLRLAQSIISKYELDELYPRFCIRQSSYHRIFSNPDSSLYYANEVVRTAPLYGLEEDAAVGHLLIGMLISNSDYPKAISHYQRAGQVWKKSGDYSGYGATLSNIANLHNRNNNLKEALIYLDSALIAAEVSVKQGHEHSWKFYTNYKTRAKVLQKMGQLDSAWTYINKGYELELNELYKSNDEKVIEIDAKYNDQKKVQQIEQQELLLEAAKKRRNLFILFSSCLIFLLSLLSYYFLKLRSANKKTETQAKEIAQSNQELSLSLKQRIALQGEVHHRVKNNLQVINSLLELQMENIKDPVALASIKGMSNRVYSMSAIHEVLYTKEDNKMVNLADYIKKISIHFNNLSGNNIMPRFNFEISDEYLNLETLIPLGIILSELLTNSLKYAKVDHQQLLIAIKLVRIKDEFRLTYSDNGAGFPNGKIEQREGGLGTYLLKSMSRQLRGRVETQNNNGAVSTIYFSVKN